MRTRMLFAALMLSLSALPTLAQEATPEATPAPDAPAVVTTYRGDAQRTGVLEAEPLAALPVVAWEFPVERPIRMTPAIAAGRAFIGSEAGMLYAVDVETGAELWRFAAGASLVSTPTIDTDGRLYVGTLGGIFYALDAAVGDVLWQSDIGGEIYSSALLLGDRLIVASTSGTLVALNPVDGVMQWLRADMGAIWSSPAASVDGDTIYVGTRAGNLLAIDPTDGAERWRVTFGAGIDATPAILDGVITIGTYDGTFAAINAADGVELWRTALGNTVYTSAAVTPEAIYVNTLGGAAFALDPATGATLWTIEIGSPAYASPVVAGSVVYFVTERDAALIAVDRATGETLWEIDTGYEGDWRASSPVIVGDRLIIGSNEASRGLIALQAGE